jgi:hypothetical protein
VPQAAELAAIPESASDTLDLFEQPVESSVRARGHGDVLPSEGHLIGAVLLFQVGVADRRRRGAIRGLEWLRSWRGDNQREP